MFGLFKRWKLKRLVALEKTPEFIKSYYIQQVSSSNEYISIDLEMTGLDLKKDKIISIAGHKIVNDSIELKDSFQIYIKNENLEETGIAEVHGILREDIDKYGVPIQEALKDFLKRISGTTVIAHGASIDMAFLNREFENHFSMSLINPVIDTMKMVKDKEVGTVITKNHYTLEECCKRYKIVQTKQHTAIDDAYVTAILFLKLNINRII